MAIVSLDDKTTKRLQGKPTWVLENISDGILLRGKAKELEEQAKGLKDKADEMLDAAFGFTGITSAVAPAWGSVTRKEGSRTTINKELLQEVLLDAGLSAIEVAACIDKATKTSSFITLEFRRPKKPVS